MNSLPYFPLSITRTHPLLFPLNHMYSPPCVPVCSGITVLTPFYPPLCSAKRGKLYVIQRDKPPSLRSREGGLGDEYV